MAFRACAACLSSRRRSSRRRSRPPAPPPGGGPPRGGGPGGWAAAIPVRPRAVRTAAKVIRLLMMSSSWPGPSFLSEWVGEPGVGQEVRVAQRFQEGDQGGLLAIGHALATRAAHEAVEVGVRLDAGAVELDHLFE